MERKLFAPLLLLAGLSLLVTPIAAGGGIPADVVLPKYVESDGWGILRTGYYFRFWPKYTAGCAYFEWHTCQEREAELLVRGMVQYWYCGDVSNPWGCIYVLQATPLEGAGVCIGAITIVNFIMSEVPDDMGVGERRVAEDPCGVVIVYGSGAYYVGRIDYLKWKGYAVDG